MDLWGHSFKLVMSLGSVPYAGHLILALASANTDATVAHTHSRNHSRHLAARSVVIFLPGHGRKYTRISLTKKFPFNLGQVVKDFS